MGEWGVVCCESVFICKIGEEFFGRAKEKKPRDVVMRPGVLVLSKFI